MHTRIEARKDGLATKREDKEAKTSMTAVACGECFLSI
jgi:hypothetical protein